MDASPTLDRLAVQASQADYLAAEAHVVAGAVTRASDLVAEATAGAAEEEHRVDAIWAHHMAGGPPPPAPDGHGYTTDAWDDIREAGLSRREDLGHDLHVVDRRRRHACAARRLVGHATSCETVAAAVDRIHARVDRCWRPDPGKVRRTHRDDAGPPGHLVAAAPCRPTGPPVPGADAAP